MTPNFTKTSGGYLFPNINSKIPGHQKHKIEKNTFFWRGGLYWLHIKNKGVQVWFGSLLDVWGSWLGFYTPKLSNLALQLGAKKTRSLHLDLGLWGILKHPDWGWHLDFDMVTGLWYSYSQFWLYLNFEGAKNIHRYLKLLKLFFWGCWRVLIRVWHLVLDLDLVTGL